jgi:Hypervirulence associated proteins TUDOR domain
VCNVSRAHANTFSVLILYKDDMAKKFKIGNHVTWNSEAGNVSGTIIKIHTKDFKYKGYTHHPTEDDPQYEIKSDKTDHIAAHKGAALKKIK